MLDEKCLNKEFICFSGLECRADGFQRSIYHGSLHCLYLNCCNHQLALCLVHLIPKHSCLTKLQVVLILLWKTYKFTTVKKTISDMINSTKFESLINNTSSGNIMAYIWWVLCLSNINVWTPYWCIKHD